MLVTFENENIKSFFDGEHDDPPVEELKYLAEHKVINSFIDEINNLIDLATRKAKKKNIRIANAGNMRENMNSFMMNLVHGLAEKDDAKLGESLRSLRDIYTLARSVSEI